MGMAATAPLLASLRLTVAAAGRTIPSLVLKMAATEAPAAAPVAELQGRQPQDRATTAALVPIPLPAAAAVVVPEVLAAIRQLLTAA